MRKVIVEVDVKHTREGEKLPLSVFWEDGRKYCIDRILDMRRAASLKVGGQGMRYYCRINGRDTYLRLEDDKWFVEAKK